MSVNLINSQIEEAKHIVIFIPVWSVTCVVLDSISVYSQSTINKMQRFSDLFISVRRSACFRRGFRPSSGAQNCTYSVRHLSDLSM